MSHISQPFSIPPPREKRLDLMRQNAHLETLLVRLQQPPLPRASGAAQAPATFFVQAHVWQRRDNTPPLF